MAYRLRPDESIPHGLRRLAKKELKAAVTGLRAGDPPGDEAVHEARKSLKKVRAIIDLIDADGGDGLAKSPKLARGASRVLSAVRDADATLEILGKLRDKDSRLVTRRAFDQMRRLLTGDKQNTKAKARRAGKWQH